MQGQCTASLRRTGWWVVLTCPHSYGRSPVWHRRWTFMSLGREKVRRQPSLQPARAVAQARVYVKGLCGPAAARARARARGQAAGGTQGACRGHAGAVEAARRKDGKLRGGLPRGVGSGRVPDRGGAGWVRAGCWAEKWALVRTKCTSAWPRSPLHFHEPAARAGAGCEAVTQQHSAAHRLLDQLRRSLSGTSRTRP